MGSAGRERGQRIAVVGAGASGLTCAHELRRAGYPEVTVLERDGRVGGKCCTVTVEGRTYEMGAVLGAGQYIRALGRMHPAGMRTGPTISGHTYDRDGGRIELVAPQDRRRLLAPALRYAWTMHGRYRRVNRPGHAAVHLDLCAPFARLARARGFGELLTPMATPFTAFGYGSFDEVPAAYVMRYLDLRTLESLSRPGHCFVWPDGLQSVWEQIAQPLDVRTGCAVQGIDRGGTVAIRTDGGDLEFDSVILTGPLDEALDYLDASPTEQRLFPMIRHEDYWVLLCQIAGLPDGVGTIPANYGSDRRGHLMMWCQRWPHDALRTIYVLGDLSMTQEQIVAACSEDLQRFGAELQRVVAVRRWKYFPHVGPLDMADGWYRELESTQGLRNTYYAGEVMSFSCIEACVSYARDLVRRFFA